MCNDHIDCCLNKVYSSFNIEIRAVPQWTYFPFPFFFLNPDMLCRCWRKLSIVLQRITAVAEVPKEMFLLHLAQMCTQSDTCTHVWERAHPAADWNLNTRFFFSFWPNQTFSHLFLTNASGLMVKIKDLNTSILLQILICAAQHCSLLSLKQDGLWRESYPRNTCQIVLTLEILRQ